jgi:hypothetical protein
LNRWITAFSIGVLATGALIAPAHAQDAAAPSSFPDVSANHWAYQSVTDLAAKGYVKGYPNGKFLGQRALTRYEFAMVIERMLQTITELNAKIAAAPATTPATPTGNYVTQDDLNKLQVLVDAFKPQLDTLTADVAALKGAAFQDQIDALRQDVLDTKTLAGKAQAAAARAYGYGPGKFQLTGYVQARYQKVSSGSQASFPNGTTATTGATQSFNGNYAVGGNNSTFFLRRSRLKATGAVTDNTRYAIQLDAGNSSAVTPVSVKEGNISYTLGDGNPTAHATITAGQFANFFGTILPGSAADFLAPERPLAFNEGGNGLWQNQDYDRGVAVSVPFMDHLRVTAAVINGTGAGTPSSSTATSGLLDKRRPDEIYRLAYQSATMNGFKNFTLGASYYNGEISRSYANGGGVIPTTAGGTAETAANFTGANYNRLHKGLGGADLSLTTNCGIFLQTEVVGGRYDERTFATTSAASPIGALSQNFFAPNNHVLGFYGQIGYTLRPTSAHPILLGVSYDEFERSRSGISATTKDQYGNLIPGGASGGSFTDKNVGYGGSYFLDKQTRFKLWYVQPTAVSHSATSANPTKVGLLTAELQVKF